MAQREPRLSPTQHPTDLTDQQWFIIEPYVTCVSPQGGRPTTIARRAIVHARIYKNRTGCQWHMLPADFPPMSTVHSYFDPWNADGTFVKLHDMLHKAARKVRDRDEEPSIRRSDSQSVKTTEVGGERGIDGGKNKRTQTSILG